MTHREHLDVEHLTRLFPGEILAHVHVVDGIQHPLQNAIAPGDSLRESSVLLTERLDLSPLLLYLPSGIIQIVTSWYGSHAYSITTGHRPPYPFFASFRHENDGTNKDTDSPKSLKSGISLSFVSFLPFPSSWIALACRQPFPSR